MSAVVYWCRRCWQSTGGCNGACQMPSPPMGSAVTLPKGCICPPASEKTCQRKDCGRRDWPARSNITEFRQALGKEAE